MLRSLVGHDFAKPINFGSHPWLTGIETFPRQNDPLLRSMSFYRIVFFGSNIRVVFCKTIANWTDGGRCCCWTEYRCVSWQIHRCNNVLQRYEYNFHNRIDGNKRGTVGVAVHTRGTFVSLLSLSFRWCVLLACQIDGWSSKPQCPGFFVTAVCRKGYPKERRWIASVHRPCALTGWGVDWICRGDPKCRTSRPRLVLQWVQGRRSVELRWWVFYCCRWDRRCHR